MVTPASPLAPRSVVPFSLDGSSSFARTGAALIALTKPRLAVFSVLTTVVACVASNRAVTWSHLALVIAGTALAAGGALSLNQWRERALDAVMRRTRGRPLPADEISPRLALAWSMALSLAGVAFLAAFVNTSSALLAAATILIYNILYTPLKRRTRWATEIGSISGALPALMGSAAAGDVFAPAGVTLTTVLLFWQMPHFFAIGWRHRADYRAAGFALLPAIDATGARTGGWSLFYSVLLLGFSLVPCALGWHGLLYGGVAAIAGLAMLRCAWQFAVHPGTREVAARKLFIASIAYLPVVMLALLVDHLLTR